MASIAQRIRKIRLLRKMTQRELGLALGFTDRTSDIRIAQYENGSRTPKEHYIEGLAYVLSVSTTSLTAPDVRDDYDMMHVLFELEDKYGFRINARLTRLLRRSAFRCFITDYRHGEEST